MACAVDGDVIVWYPEAPEEEETADDDQQQARIFVLRDHEFGAEGLRDVGESRAAEYVGKDAHEEDNECLDADGPAEAEGVDELVENNAAKERVSAYFHEESFMEWSLYSEVTHGKTTPPMLAPVATIPSANALLFINQVETALLPAKKSELAPIELQRDCARNI